jgi:hypothetical protein
MALLEHSRRHLSSGRRKVVSNEFAWNVHTTMEGWTARADLKASILLALQGGALFAIFTSEGLLTAARSRWPVVVTTVAVALLLVATGLSAAALMPALGSSRRLRAERKQQFVYFGHLRHWPADEFGRALVELTPRGEAVMLAEQIVRLGQLNWRKHRLLQVSVALTVLVLTAFAVAGIGLLR